MRALLSAFALSLLFRTYTAQQENCINKNPLSTSCTSIGSTRCSQFYPQALSHFPNNVTSSINDAVTSLNQYLLASDCSPYARVYFCLALLPPCTPNSGALNATYQGPCESFCQLVSSSCSNPSTDSIDMNEDCLISSCSRFPSENCVSVDDPLVVMAVEAISTSPPDLSTATAMETTAMEITTTTNSSTSIPLPSPSSAPPFPILSSCPLPNNTFFSDASKSFAVGWVSFWSILCFLSTSLTILTFLLETSRFQYPWRPVVYLAVVFNVHSLTYFFSLALGRSIVTCPGGQFVESGSPWTWAHTPCILIFIFLYYTIMAAFIWWVVLTVCWFLVAALKWSHEAVGKLSAIFHIAAWVLPLLMTIGVLAARVLGADELTATCFVVSNGTRPAFLALLLAVILPLVLFLLTGLVFLLIGFISILRVRAYMRKGGKQQEQQTLEKLMIRIGIFVAIYIVPATILIACFVYELASRSSWLALSEPCSNCTRPNSAVFMVRIFMFLLIGVLTGVWIWSRKTLRSWQQCPAKCSICCNPVAEEAEQDMELPASVLAAENALSTQKMPSYSFPDSGLDSS